MEQGLNNVLKSIDEEMCMHVTGSGNTTHDAESVWREFAHVQNINRCRLLPALADKLVKGYHNLRQLRQRKQVVRDSDKVLQCWYPSDSDDDDEPEEVRVQAQPSVDASKPLRGYGPTLLGKIESC